LNYQVAPAKIGLISRGEHHLLSCQILHMGNRKRVRSRQRSLLHRFPAQIETSVSFNKNTWRKKTFRTVVIYFSIKNKYFLSNMRLYTLLCAACH
jgi:hypothetical protein